MTLRHLIRNTRTGPSRNCRKRKFWSKESWGRIFRLRSRGYRLRRSSWRLCKSLGLEDIFILRNILKLKKRSAIPSPPSSKKEKSKLSKNSRTPTPCTSTKRKNSSKSS